MRYFDAFTGIGGFTLAIKRTDPNAECVGYSEIDKYAASVYQHHYPTHINYGDITKIDANALPDFDLLCGGFPCQAFSIAGKRAGFSDTRGTLFFDLARIAEQKRPRLLLFENVKGLLSHEDGRTFYTIISTLDELGYDLQWQVLNSKDFGVPQNRERIFIAGHLRGTPRPEVFPFIGIEKPNTIANERHFIRTENINGDAFYHPYSGTLRAGASKSTNIVDNIRRLTPLECERLQGFPDNWTAICSDSQRYKQCGNAVTANVVQAIIERMVY